MALRCAFCRLDFEDFAVGFLDGTSAMSLRYMHYRAHLRSDLTSLICVSSAMGIYFSLYSFVRPVIVFISVSLSIKQSSGRA